MRIRNKKILIFVISIVVVLVILGIVLAYLFLATDTFKSNKELFQKYGMQNIETLKEMKQSSIYNIYKNLENEQRYEANTKVSINYSEGGEISNPFNDLSFEYKMQKDDEYIYKDAQVLYKDEEYLEIEGIKDQNVYGIRFSDAVKQFLSVRNNEDVMQVQEDIGLDQDILSIAMDIIDGNTELLEEVISKEELQTLKEKYLNIVMENLNKATYSRQKNATITLNNNTIQTNSYNATLASNQVQDLIVQILNNIKTDEIILNKIKQNDIIDQDEFITNINEIIENLGIDKEIPTIKITVFEQKGTTVRTVIEIGSEKIIIENSKDGIQLKTKIQRSVLNNEHEKEQTIEIVKSNSDNEETSNIKIYIIEGEDEYSIEFNLQMQYNDGEIVTIVTCKYLEGITNIGIRLENTISTKEFGEKVVLDAANNVILNDIEKELRERILSQVQEIVPEKLKSRTQKLLEELRISQLVENAISEIINSVGNQESQNPNISTEEFENPQLPQVEINRFNAKFEFYTGDSVSAENVKTLLDIVKDHLESIEIIPIENQEETNSEEIEEDVKLNIEKDNENIELANQILQKIDDGKKYKVSISYNPTNGIIDYIMISEVKQ